MLSVDVAILCTIASVILAALSYINNRDKDRRNRTVGHTEQNTSVKEELKFISRGIEDIKYDTKSLATSVTAMNERLIRAEEVIKVVNKDLCELRKDVGELQREQKDIRIVERKEVVFNEERE